MKVGVIGAGTMGQGIAKAFAQVEGYEVALCDIKQEWADGGKAKIQKGYARLVEKGKMTQEAVDAILAKITPGLKEDLCADCDLIVEAAFEDMGVKKTIRSQNQSVSLLQIHQAFPSQRSEMVLHVQWLVCISSTLQTV